MIEEQKKKYDQICSNLEFDKVFGFESIDLESSTASTMGMDSFKKLKNESIYLANLLTIPAKPNEQMHQ